MSIKTRLLNARNVAQGDAKCVLCVCSAGLLRSSTLAEILGDDPYYFNTRSVGCNRDYALIPLELVHVAWADEIVVFEKSHYNIVQNLIECLESFAFEETPRVHLFSIEDDYSFRDPVLIDRLQQLSALTFR